MNNHDELEEILEQLQFAHNYADNTEPCLTNQRTEAKQAIQSIIDRAVLEARRDEWKQIMGRGDVDNDRMAEERISELKSQGSE